MRAPARHSARTGQARRTSRPGRVLLSAVALLAAGCASPSPPPPPAAGTALTNFTLIDGTDRNPVPQSAMLIGDDGRIQWVGPGSELPRQTSATPVDLGGAFVMPGLINLHAHIGNTIELTQAMANHTPESVRRELGTYASYGVTTVVSMGTDQDDVFALREEQREGRPAVARLYTVGQGLVFKGGYGGLDDVNTKVSTPEEARAEVDRQAAKHVDFIKLWLDDELGTMPKMPAAISKAIIDRAHEKGLRAVAHIFYLEDAKRLADQGIDGFVHGVRDKPVDRALIDSMKQHGAWQAAGTLSREASFAVGANPPFAHDPFFTKGITPRTLELFTDPARLQTVAANPNYKRFPQFLATAEKNLKTLYDAGVPIGFGTDAGPPGRFPGFFEHWELQLMVEAGFTPQQAIAAATRHAAEFLKANDLGTIENGKWADLIVLDADPFADILNTRKIRAVYLAGKEIVPVTKK